MAMQFGATDTIEAAGDVPEAVRALTSGRGAEFVFDTVGSPATLTTALAATRKGGAVVLTGLSRVDSQGSIPMFPFVMQEKRLIGSVYGSGQPARDIPRLVSLYQEGKLKLGELVSRTYPLEKVNDALTSGSSLALASAAFLAVYREGFETVLFYKALFLTGPSGGAMPIVMGILLGSVVMVGVYIAISRFGLRLPLKPFFGVTSAFLYYMAFVFAGKGVAELQDGGTIPTTIVLGAPRLPALGIYPTVESLLLQGVLVLLLVVAVVWTFVVAPRRGSARSSLRAPMRTKPASAAASRPVPQGASLELLRSLERMEADLGEMKAEVERMKGNLTEAPESRAQKR